MMKYIVRKGCDLFAGTERPRRFRPAELKQIETGFTLRYEPGMVVSEDALPDRVKVAEHPNVSVLEWLLAERAFEPLPEGR